MPNNCGHEETTFVESMLFNKLEYTGAAVKAVPQKRIVERCVSCGNYVVRIEDDVDVLGFRRNRRKHIFEGDEKVEMPVQKLRSRDV